MPRFAVERPRLVRRLDQAFSKRLTALIAPAGYGKSVLLGQWAQERADRTIAWLVIDRDVDAMEIAQHLVEAIATTHPGFGNLCLERLDLRGQTMGSPFLEALLVELQDLDPTVLVIEDLHRVSNAAILEELATVIEHAPPQVHFVVAARADLPLGRRRLRTDDEIVEIRQDALAFDRRDSVQLVDRLAGVEMGEHHLDILQDRTEGWPVGLHEAALALRGRGDITPFLDSFGGDDRHVADYLTAEVLERESDEIRDFLLQTSILERLTAPLCDVITDAGGSQRLLESLDQRSLFLVPLDGHREWYRYHGLFRDLLRYRLRAEDRELERSLLRRAADWHSGRGDPDGAAGYLAEAEAWDELADMAVACTREFYERGEEHKILRWFEALPDQTFERSDVELSCGILHGTVGRALVADYRLGRVATRGAASMGERLVADVWRANLVQWHLEPQSAIDIGERVLQTVDRVDSAELPNPLGLMNPPTIRFMARAAIGRAALYQGDLDRARSTIEGALAESDATYPIFRVHALGSSAMVAVRAGELTAGQDLATRALSVAGDFDAVDHPATADAYLALTEAHYRRDDLATASLLLDQAEVQARRNGRDVLLWLHATLAAQLALARGDADEALTLLQQVSSGGLAPPPGVVGERVRAVEGVAHLLLGEIDRAERIALEWRAPRSPELAALATRVAVARDDIPRARKALDQWPAGETPGSRALGELWAAIVEDLDDEPGRPVDRIAAVVDELEMAGDIRFILDQGNGAVHLVRELYERAPTGWRRRIVERPSAGGVREEAPELVEQLSGREMAVLRFLPTRLSNQEVATQLYVSINTLKTHLKHIYRKLDVTSRRDAIARAEELGLL